MSLAELCGAHNDNQAHSRWISGISQVAQDYDGLIVDLWGVIHDGEVLFPNVLNCLQQLKQAGKSIVFLSNSPRRAYGSKDKLKTFGVDPESYLGIWTSGEEVFQQLKGRQDPWYEALGKRCYHLGARLKGSDIFEQLDLEIVPEIDDADFIINTGPIPQDRDVDSYQPLLER